MGVLVNFEYLHHDGTFHGLSMNISKHGKNIIIALEWPDFEQKYKEKDNSHQIY